MTGSLVAEAKTALLVSPSLGGHRRVYASVLSRLLTAQGYQVCIATRYSDERDDVFHPCIDTLGGKVPSVRFVDIGQRSPSGPSLRLDSLLGVAREVRPDITILAEADNHLRLLVDQGAGEGHRLPGRRVGVFIRATNYIYNDHPAATLREVAHRIRSYPTKWSQDRRLFLSVLLPRMRLLDAALCLDELFVAAHEAPYRWLPDIFRTFNDSEDGGREIQRWQPLLADFLRTNDARPVFVYCGNPQQRHGYDWLLKLAVEERGCFVHCGRRDAPTQFDFDPHELRHELSRRDALFETNEFIADFDTIDLFLRAGSCLVLPYQHHYGSSGIMLQALHVGRPVLVPDNGLMGCRVRTHGLGLTYRHGDWEDMRQKSRILAASPAETYDTAIKEFMRYFSQEHVEAALSLAFGSDACPVSLPNTRRYKQSRQREGAFSLRSLR